MKPSPALLVTIASAALVTPAFAVVNIDYVTVGNTGNAADPATLYGAVSYAYNIGKYEVTNSQYAGFLNSKGASNAGAIFNSSMAAYGITQTGSSGSFSYNVTSGFENKPVVYVSWFDAARFTNWLGNGQGSADMEAGAYTLEGATSGIITVNSGATVYLPSENEWYKAAYYNGATSSYSLYPNGQDSITNAHANYDWIVGASSDVGSYVGDPSSYGTFDQGGNVQEWNDGIIGSSRVLRGGAWNHYVVNVGGGEALLRSSFRDSLPPSGEGPDFGFRVASAIPEPSSFLLTMLAGGMMLIRRIR